jgi:hypothetical protein
MHLKEDDERPRRAPAGPDTPTEGIGGDLLNRTLVKRPGPAMAHARGMTNGNGPTTGKGLEVDVGLINGLSREAASPLTEPPLPSWRRPRRKRRTVREALARKSLEPLPGA